MMNPDEKLSSSPDKALKRYRQQTRRLAKNPVLKEAVIAMEAKLHEAKFVGWLKDLPKVQRQKILGAVARYYIPWQIAENENSVSTPVRLVFDASAIDEETGYSLNCLVAKGIKSLNSMYEIYIRFRCFAVALHTDVKKMYNHIKLKSEDWRFQLYFWQKDLDVNIEPMIKVIMTIIYGVKASGNQAECALRKLAELLKHLYPEAAHAIKYDTYMDDTVTGTTDIDKADALTADLSAMLSQGGFSTKGYTISGRPPPASLSKDGVSVGVLGGKWLSETDEIQLCIGPVTFATKNVGKGKRKSGEKTNIVPKQLTKRVCAGKVGAVFDLIGLVCPIVAGFKIDLHELHLSYDWDDVLSDVDREIWVKNFQLMEDLSSLIWPRAVIPADAVSLDMELIGAGDASKRMACGGCYIRFKRKDGTYSCQLMSAKSKIVSDDITLPRAELFASTINTHLTEVVKRSLKNQNIINVIYILDSEIVLHWLCSQTKRLNPWVRNRCIETARYSDPQSDWFHVSSEDNPVDIATRKGAKVTDVDRVSEWFNGKAWMRLPIEESRESVLKNVHEITIKNEHVDEIKKEEVKLGTDLCRSDFNLVYDDPKATASVYVTLPNPDVFVVQDPSEDVSSIINERLTYSKYLIDPNKFRFSKVVRILAIVIRVTKVWMKTLKSRRDEDRILKNYSVYCPPEEVSLNPKEDTESRYTFQFPIKFAWVNLLDQEIQFALNYIFRKTTDELKKFVPAKCYENMSVEKDGILYHVGRVFTYDIEIEDCGYGISDKMIDLSKHTFVVPIVDRYSPVAFSIVNDIHWNHNTAKHGGVETTIRAIMTIAHILKVRDLVKLFKKNCKRCRYILKRTVDVMMGSASKEQLKVAPPFYITQVDLCGPFNSYSKNNKRATVKVWMAVFVCSTTGMTSIKIMEGYDTVQFLYAFTRFSDDFGFPKKMLADEGSQLVCGCESVVLNMTDIKSQLNREYGIDFETCPVGGHNFHGRVERKIRTIKDILVRSIHNARLSVIEWETLCSEIANSINDLPVAIGNETESLENLDLITPNRLRIARNNSRSPVGPLEVTGKIERLIRLKNDVFQSWWEAWLVSALPRLIPKPKWFTNDVDIKCGDIVLFDKSDASFVGEYKYGIVDEIHRSKDSKIRSATIRYRNASEEIFRTTNRAVRSIVVIHRIDEVDIME